MKETIPILEDEDSKGSDGKGSDGTQRDGQGSGAAAKRKKTWMHNGVEFSSEPYPWKGKMFFFAVSTGGGLESIFVEEGSTVWAHYEKEDYMMIAGEDDKWVNKCYKITKAQEIFKPNQKPTLINNSESEFYPVGGGGGGHEEKNAKHVANVAITSGIAAKNITYPSSRRASRSMSIAVFA